MTDVDYGTGCCCDWLGIGTPEHTASALCISLRPDADRDEALPVPRWAREVEACQRMDAKIKARRTRAYQSRCLAEVDRAQCSRDAGHPGEHRWRREDLPQ